MEHLEFLHEEFVDMIAKSQWVVLPAEAVADLPGLRISPPGVVPQRDRRPRWICDYTWSQVNQETLPLAPLESMQFGHALDRILRELLLSDPALGPVDLLKLDISDGFYRINLSVDDIPKLGVAFPTRPEEPKLVALPLVLPMGWKNSPPIFSAATETIADLANKRIREGVIPAAHPLDEAAEAVTPSSPLGQDHHAPDADPFPPRDPSLPSNRRASEYVDVFVDDFIALAQGRRGGRRVRRLLLHAVDDVLRPLDATDSPFRREPVSLKKLRNGDCSWATVKLVLGWIIDTESMTIHLPPHRVTRLAEILASIPVTQKRTSVKKWHKVIGELRSMSLALPGARNLFSHMQHALANKVSTRVTLTKGVHQALDDFRWLLRDISSRPTRIAELVPLLSSAEGHHDASGAGAGGVWFPAEHLIPRQGATTQPLVWRLRWPQRIADLLVTDANPNGTISNSDLELAGGLLHLEALAQTFDIRERTALSKTDNLNTLFWQRKGSTTTDKVPAHLLRMFGAHQRFHRYVPRHDYIAGPSNPVADALSRDFHLALGELMTSLSKHFPSGSGYQVWEPSPAFVQATLAALMQKRQPLESLLVPPPPPQQRALTFSLDPIEWPSMPTSKPSRVKYDTYKKADDEFVNADLRASRIPSGLDRLKVTYGSLGRRRHVWGPRSSIPSASPSHRHTPCRTGQPTAV